jgi:hypothetical protein
VHAPRGADILCTNYAVHLLVVFVSPTPIQVAVVP